jgi:hypothetical protein
VSDAVAIEYELMAEDWLQAMMSHLDGSPFHRRGVRRVRILLALIVALLAMLFLLEGMVLQAATFGVLGFVPVTLVPTLVRRNQRRQYRSFARDGLARGTFGRHRLVLTDEGILDSTDGRDLLIHWSAVERVVDAGGSLLVYNGPNSFLIVPTSAFPDRSAFERFSRRFFAGLESSGRVEAITGGSDGPPGTADA